MTSSSSPPSWALAAPFWAACRALLYAAESACFSSCRHQKGFIFYDDPEKWLNQYQKDLHLSLSSCKHQRRIVCAIDPSPEAV